jgi:hypothetical protein
VPAPVEIDSVPDAEVVDVGANCTVTVQVPLTASVAVHVVDTKLKPEPVTDAAVGTVIVSGPAPVLVKVADAVLVLLTGVAGKDGVDNVAVGAIPVPLKVAAFVPAPVTRLNEPVRAPPAVAVKFNVTVHEAPAASEFAQVVDTKEKSAPVTEDADGTVTERVAMPVFVSVADAS